MDLKTKYLGMELRTPLMASASPLSEDVATIKKLEESGASAVVLYSLFEEQLTKERVELHHHLTQGTDSFAEALTYFPEPSEFKLGPEEYLNHIRKAKEAVKIPVIASLNGTSTGGWTDYAKKMQQAGADALELNIYYIPTDMNLSSEQIEKTYIDILTSVKSVVSIPVALKLSPFFSNMASMAKKLDDAGADALVLFNRFYQPDIDLDSLEVRPHLLLSTTASLRLPLRWIALLYGRIKADMAATGGIHEVEDALKVLMAGASVTMLCSTLLRHGVNRIRILEQGIRAWMEEHEYESIQQLRGSISQKNCVAPTAFERAQYMKTLQSYKA
ncbi:MAG TPA: dihydroorotate dehydrogenase-like protein [Elusimicrobiota bacterium]|nr:dihydroorotate dehydrogenase-like protein [Elusimicrobiota bacterium]